MRYGIEVGRVELMIGTSSVDIKLNGEVRIGESASVTKASKVFFSDEKVQP